MKEGKKNDIDYLYQVYTSKRGEKKLKLILGKSLSLVAILSNLNNWTRKRCSIKMFLKYIASRKIYMNLSDLFQPLSIVSSLSTAVIRGGMFLDHIPPSMIHCTNKTERFKKEHYYNTIMFSIHIH